ncbi:MAG: cytochrome C [Burkholderiaceae bacterium]|jgi:cytochrome c|nr:cytochrome C [Burkholderiaceae bacterium]
MPRSLAAALALALASALAAAQSPAPADTKTMLKLADDSNCLTCHDLEQKLRGPAWRDVAKRYRGDASAEEKLVKKVHEGGGGVWGDDYMSANRRAGLENIRTLVRWILKLES